jgi:uncharacterized protein (TIGR03435 family)
MHRGCEGKWRARYWRALSALITVFCSGSTYLQAQTAPSFSAASVKLNRSGDNARQSITPGRIAFDSVSVKECIMAAFNLRGYQVAGPPSLSASRFDIAATAEGPASDAELRAMLKTLLAERFKLKFHLETRDLPAYRLIANKNGHKLRPASSSGPGNYALDGGFVEFHAFSMSAFADYLSRLGPIDHPVIDGTGIVGIFDFKLKLFETRPDLPLNELKRAYYEWNQGSSIFEDLQAQLALKLQPAKVPFSVLVVDSVEMPSEN